MESANRLVTELNRLGVHFVTGGELEQSAPSLPSAELIAGLVTQFEARLRLALIPLFLVHPELATAIPEALARLSEREQLTLKLFYTAAVILQQCHTEQLRTLLGQYDPLPDHFAMELGIPATGDCLDRLKQLGERHQALSGLAINWVGTYRHAADRLLRQLTLPGGAMVEIGSPEIQDFLQRLGARYPGTGTLISSGVAPYVCSAVLGAHWILITPWNHQERKRSSSKPLSRS